VALSVSSGRSVDVRQTKRWFLIYDDDVVEAEGFTTTRASVSWYFKVYGFRDESQLYTSRRDGLVALEPQIQRRIRRLMDRHDQILKELERED
jgi:hypothetical protein